MENFKQIAEDCLSGKLSGTFVLRNTDKVKSSDIIRKSSLTCSYWSRLYGFFSDNGHCYNDCKHYPEYDIITFIPDMKKEQITIDIPKGMTVIREETPNEIKIKFVQKNLTYDDIWDSMDPKLRIFPFATPDSNKVNDTFFDKVNVLRKLTNIRNYFGKPKHDTYGHALYYTIERGIHTTPALYPSNDQRVIFDTKEHAEQAIKMLDDELKYLFEPW